MSAVVEPQPATDSEASAEPDRRPPRSPRWYVPLVLLLALVLFASVGIANRRLNPLVYDQDHIQTVAAALVNGQNYANYDTNINWRALRREQIKLLPAAPDVIVFGGSRWWEATSELLPGQTFFNAWVSNDQAEDALALTYLLEEADRLPDTLVLSLRFISFQPPDERESAEWQEWAPEYRAMANRLDLPAHSYLTTFPAQKLRSTFFAPELYDRVYQVSQAPEPPGITDDLQRQSLEIIASDGSIRWSRDSEARFTKQFVDEAVRSELDRVGQNAPKIDHDLVAAMATNIQYLQERGVRVVVAQTPYHPDFYREIQDRPFGQTLRDLQVVADDMNRSLGVVAVGSYDPAELDCTADEFIDHIHARTSCVGRVLQLIPGIEQEN